jgi:hypothetical protein
MNQAVSVQLTWAMVTMSFTGADAKHHQHQHSA